MNEELIKQLDIKAGMIELGERIAYGSDSSLMRQAARALEAANRPAGKPIAWMDNDGNFSDHNEYKTFNIPLYTHPAPQVPMTDAELEELYWDHSNNQIESMEASGWTEFARAIEAHHKIGVTK